MGRPAFKIDLEVLEGLAGLRLSQADIAGIMGCSVRTIEKGLAEDEAVRAAYDKGQAGMKEKVRTEVLRRAMSKNEDGSWQLLMHLDKTQCGATEKIEIEHKSSTDEEPGMSIETKRRSMAELMGENPNDPGSGLEDDG